MNIKEEIIYGHLGEFIDITYPMDLKNDKERMNRLKNLVIPGDGDVCNDCCNYYVGIDNDDFIVAKAYRQVGGINAVTKHIRVASPASEIIYSSEILSSVIGSRLIGATEFVKYNQKTFLTEQEVMDCLNQNEIIDKLSINADNAIYYIIYNAIMGQVQNPVYITVPNNFDYEEYCKKAIVTIILSTPEYLRRKLVSFSTNDTEGKSFIRFIPESKRNSKSISLEQNTGFVIEYKKYYDVVKKLFFDSGFSGLVYDLILKYPNYYNEVLSGDKILFLYKIFSWSEISRIDSDLVNEWENFVEKKDDIILLDAFTRVLGKLVESNILGTNYLSENIQNVAEEKAERYFGFINYVRLMKIISKQGIDVPFEVIKDRIDLICKDKDSKFIRDELDIILNNVEEFKETFGENNFVQMSSYLKDTLKMVQEREEEEERRRREAEIERKEQEIKRREDAVASREEESNRREESITSKEQEIKRREEAITSREEAIERREEAVTRKEEGLKNGNIYSESTPKSKKYPNDRDPHEKLAFEAEKRKMERKKQIIIRIILGVIGVLILVIGFLAGSLVQQGLNKNTNNETITEEITTEEEIINTTESSEEEIEKEDKKKQNEELTEDTSEKTTSSQYDSDKMDGDLKDTGNNEESDEVDKLNNNNSSSITDDNVYSFIKDSCEYWITGDYKKADEGFNKIQLEYQDELLESIEDDSRIKNSNNSSDSTKTVNSDLNNYSKAIKEYFISKIIVDNDLFDVNNNKVVMCSYLKDDETASILDNDSENKDISGFFVIEYECDEDNSNLNNEDKKESRVYYFDGNSENFISVNKTEIKDKIISKVDDADQSVDIRVINEAITKLEH